MLAEGDSLGLKEDEDDEEDLLLVRGCLRGRPEASEGSEEWGEGIWGDEDTCRDCVP